MKKNSVGPEVERGSFGNLPKPTRISSVEITPTKEVPAMDKAYDITPTTRARIVELQAKHNEELSKARREVASKKYEVDKLRSKMMQLTTQRQENELDQEILNGKFYGSAKIAMSKEAELNGLELRLENEVQDLKKTVELERKELLLNHQSRVQQLSKSFESKVDQTMKNKVKFMENQKSQLSQGVDEYEDKIRNIEITIIQQRQAIEQKYNGKFEEVSDMVKTAEASLLEETQLLDLELAKQTNQINKLEQESQALVNENKSLDEQVDKNNSEANSILEKVKNIESIIESLNNESNSLELQIKESQQLIESRKRSTIEFAEQFEVEERKRRLLNNILQDLKGNIRVFCRVRPPMFQQQLMSMTFSLNVGDQDQEELILEDPRIPNKVLAVTKPLVKKTSFKFDKVFDMESSNNDIFEEISPLVQSCVNGYNICLFAYGQTGSGKTFTMSEQTSGMIPRSVDQIFEDISKLSNLKNSAWKYHLKGRFLEIYNENVIDLISDSYDPNKKHEIRHDSTTMRTTITGLTEAVLTDPRQVSELLQKANKNRSTASTKANEHSSRSHSIFILDVDGENTVTNEKTHGSLNLIDLAGSERLSSSQATGERLKETQSINKSLSALGDVISALKNKTNNSHIPFRNSKLTYLLQYSLSGDSKTLMFVNVSPLASHYSESVNSLRFAMKVNNTKIN